LANGHPAHSHAHHHAHHGLGWAVAVTITFVVAEAIAGWLGGSLALLSDAFHNLADAAALGLSWYALKAAETPSHHRMTYGYHRVGIVAAFVNAVALVLIAAVIAWEAVTRLGQPEPASGALMIGVAIVAVAVNVAIGMRLHHHAAHDINIRSAYLHMMGDAASAGAVVVAGVIVLLTGKTVADPIVSLVIAALIVYSTYEVFRETVTVMLEGTPVGLDMPSVVSTIRGVDGVLDVHDLHVWTVGPGMVACSCHVLVGEQSVREGQDVLRRVVRALDDGFHITHTTVQIEVEGCPPEHEDHAAPRVS
jgi:cobalt-zinc-cadmium efflux system protein